MEQQEESSENQEDDDMEMVFESSVEKMNTDPQRQEERKTHNIINKYIGPEQTWQKPRQHNNILTDMTIRSEVQNQVNNSNKVYTLSNQDIMLCLEFMKSGGGSQRQTQTLKRTFPLLKKELRQKKIDLSSQMESLKFDKQKAKFLKEETENYFLQIQQTVQCSFQRIRQQLNDKEKALTNLIKEK